MEQEVVRRKNQKPKRKIEKKYIAIIVIALFTGVFHSSLEFIVNWLWFKELNYVSVFFTKLFSELKIGVPAFVIISVFAYAYLMLLKKSYVKNIEISVHSATNGRLNLADSLLTTSQLTFGSMFCSLSTALRLELKIRCSNRM